MWSQKTGIKLQMYEENRRTKKIFNMISIRYTCAAIYLNQELHLASIYIFVLIVRICLLLYVNIITAQIIDGKIEMCA